MSEELIYQQGRWNWRYAHLYRDRKPTKVTWLGFEPSKPTALQPYVNGTYGRYANLLGSRIPAYRRRDHQALLIKYAMRMENW